MASGRRRSVTVYPCVSERVCACRAQKCVRARVLSPILRFLVNSSLFLLPWQQAPQPQTLLVPWTCHGSLPIYSAHRAYSHHRKALPCLHFLHRHAGAQMIETSEEWCGIATCHPKSTEQTSPSDDVRRRNDPKVGDWITLVQNGHAPSLKTSLCAGHKSVSTSKSR